MLRLRLFPLGTALALVLTVAVCAYLLLEDPVIGEKTPESLYACKNFGNALSLINAVTLGNEDALRETAWVLENTSPGDCGFLVFDEIQDIERIVFSRSNWFIWKVSTRNRGRYFVLST